MSIQVILALAVFVGAYVLIATEKVPRVTVALVGAGLMVIIGATDKRGIFFSQESGIDSASSSNRVSSSSWRSGPRNGRRAAPS
jgi:Na+/H+ antiporter NhaD/arsenite permease-like protein